MLSPRTDKYLIRLVDKAVLGLMVVDSDGVIIFFNEWVQRASGINRSDAIGRNLTDVFPEIVGTRLNTAIEAALSKQLSSRLNYKVNKVLFPLSSLEGGGGGKPMQQRVSITPEQLDDGSIVCFIQINDVTYDSEREELLKDQALNLRKAQAELESINDALENRVVQRTKELETARTAAEKANKAKTVFLANMSHEIRTPLNAILGITQMISMGYAGEVPEKQKDLLENIESSAKHLTDLISAILDTATIEVGELTLDESVFDIGELITESVALLSQRAEQAEIRLSTTVDSATISLNGDRLRVKQALINLIENAIKYSPKNTVVDISIDQLDNGDVAVRVVDSGIGIPQHEIENIFEPFSQVKEDATVAGNAGIGLGLALVKSIMELHDGSVDIESVHGKGTTASLVFRAERVALSG